ncbi:branched-chain amino acid ABC transporter permease [Zavarzinia compransoris]|uniref:Branched-chain amino acid ABC transporter permease n=1 Tax=Zavarzinia compransoris TaxID=1264899 RepID=A0A317E4R4_9PROT|nr:branched-chain amino acid ABC transporter permease [Zavarzinia compransoris]PWR21631.1 hypothetical protein DKG75_06420 [Zavarzinia compransoris]TDP45589.1 amino acid/amide ABC transporter membrane protein 2 (HAAT family) [Zavarzinia compransoris]
MTRFFTFAWNLRTGAVLPQLACLGLFLLAVALLPLLVNDYWVRLFTFVFINIGLATSWNLIGGFAGYASFGHGVFFGLGAFVSAIGTVRYGLPLPVCMLAAGAVNAAIALLFTPIMRQKGLYFALSTLAVMLVFETVLQRWTFTRGLGPYDLGWSVEPAIGLAGFYYLFLALLALAVGGMIVIARSRLGYALHAIRKDEILAASIGIRTTRYKVIAFALSAIWPGILGAVFAPFISFVSVQSVMDVSITLNMILITIFGGAGTILGPIVGGIGLSVIDQIAWGNFLEYHRLIYGALIVCIITFHPGGLVSLFWSIAGRLRRPDREQRAGDAPPPPKA